MQGSSVQVVQEKILRQHGIKWRQLKVTMVRRTPALSAGTQVLSRGIYEAALGCCLGMRVRQTLEASRLPLGYSPPGSMVHHIKNYV